MREQRKPKQKVVGAPSAEAQEIKTDERDQRVKKLLTMDSREARLKQVIEWIGSGEIDVPTSLDLMKIVTREAEVTEAVADLRKTFKQFAVRSPKPAVEAENFRQLVGRLPTLISKLETVVGDE